jgi:hypothetical protein
MGREAPDFKRYKTDRIINRIPYRYRVCAAQVKTVFGGKCPNMLSPWRVYSGDVYFLHMWCWPKRLKPLWKLVLRIRFGHGS